MKGGTCEIKEQRLLLVNTHSRTALAESVVLNLVNVLTYSRVLLYTLQLMILRWQRIMKALSYAVSGASLSLFSSRYLTSEIKRQPALLNSEAFRKFNFVHGPDGMYANLHQVSMQMHLLPLSAVGASAEGWSLRDEVCLINAQNT